MGWAWDVAGLPGIVSGLASWALAFLVYRTRPDRFQNRLLALFLVFTGASWFAFHGLGTFSTDRDIVVAMGVTFLFLHWTAHMWHLMFVSTLPTPLVRPFRSRIGRLVIVWVWLAMILDVAMRPRGWIPGATPAVSEGTWMITLGPRFGAAAPLFILLFLIGLAAGFDAWRRARRGPLAAQTRAYLAAFAVHDGGLALWNIVMYLYGANLSAGARESMTHWLPPLLNIWMVSFLAWGILKTQLFDIDLKVKWVFERSTIASVLIGAFWLGGELIEAFLPVGESPFWGLLVAGAVALAFRPLARGAQRLAGRVFPGVDDSEQYLSGQKLLVYRSTIAGALEDGEVTNSERAMMDALRGQLGITVAQARKIERELGVA